MATEIELARTMIHKTAWLKDQGRPYNKEAAMAKLYATEMAERVCYDAIQIHGGNGYSREYNVERMYRDARLIIGEGTSNSKIGDRKARAGERVSNHNPISRKSTQKLTSVRSLENRIFSKVLI